MRCKQLSIKLLDKESPASSSVCQHDVSMMSPHRRVLSETSRVLENMRDISKSKDF